MHCGCWTHCPLKWVRDAFSFLRSRIRGKESTKSTTLRYFSRERESGPQNDEKRRAAGAKTIHQFPVTIRERLSLQQKGCLRANSALESEAGHTH